MKSSFARDADPRLKLICLVAVSVALTWASAYAVAGVGVVAYAVGRSAGVRAKGLVGEVRLVLLIVGVGVVARAVSDPKGVVAGGRAGAVAGGRFFVIILLAYVFSATTRTGEIRLAVESLFRPLPFVNETDWGTMFAASARFFPLVRDKAGQVRDARKARLGDEQRWYTRLRSSAFALLTRSFRRADTLALAMQSRGYTSKRTSLRRLEWERGDTLLLVGGFVVGIGAYFL